MSEKSLILILEDVIKYLQTIFPNYSFSIKIANKNIYLILNGGPILFDKIGREEIMNKHGYIISRSDPDFLNKTKEFWVKIVKENAYRFNT